MSRSDKATAPPLVGITAIGPDELPFQTAHTTAFISSPQTYVDCVIRAGGIPVLIPPVGSDFAGLVTKLDGVIFSGGTDIHPELYGGQADHPNLNKPDKERDRFEFGLMQAALGQSKPILAICRGVQVLNVALGGTLIEHLPEHLADDPHRGDDGLWGAHEIVISAKSRLGRIVKLPQVSIVSAHHQALKTVADGLNIVARSGDAVVEAVELLSHPWCIGLQWHPEESAHGDQSQQNIFDALVAQAGVNLV